MPMLRFAADDSPETALADVWSTMLYPSDSDRAFEAFVKNYLTTTHRVCDLPNTEPVSLPASWIKALVAGPSFKEMLDEAEVNRPGFRGGRFG